MSLPQINRSIPAAVSASSSQPDLAYKKISVAFFDWVLVGFLLAVALLGAWLPVDWVRQLKRPVQAPNYAWLGAAYSLFYAGAAWWLYRNPENETRYRRRWLALLILVLVPNLFNIWLRYTTPLSATDPRPLFGRDADMGLFFDYGQDLIEGRWSNNPQEQYAEYPHLSLPLFWLGARLSRSHIETFYWVFPLLLVPFQLGAGAALYGIGRKLGRARAAFLLAAWIAGSPALYLFGYTRFDVVPAALLLAGVYFAIPSDLRGVKGMQVRRRWTWLSALAGGTLMVGGLVKWLPGVVWPWLLAAYWRTRNRAGLLAFSLSTLLAGLVLTLPALMINTPALLYPYQFQGNRKLIGESFWFLVQDAFFDPAHATPEKPWGQPPTVILENSLLTVAQLFLTGLVLGLALWRLWTQRSEQEAFSRWACAGLVGLAIFTLTNRIFSPQYMVLLVWAWAAALVLRPVGWRGLAVGFILMGLAAGANFEVYLLGVYPDIWVRDSAVMFVASFVLSGWLLWRALARLKAS
jgi:hypothetical protein